MDVTGRIDTKDPNKTHKEVQRIYENLFGSNLFNNVDYTLGTIIELFDGKYSGYQKCDTSYHDLEHTLQAYLAMARILDGLIRIDGKVLGEEFFVLGLISALGHDTGYIKETLDKEGSGAKYTLIHVERSNEFMGEFLPRLKFAPSQIQYVKNMISCTGWGVNIARINFTAENERKTGYVLGTADFLGQMSDPAYPVKLYKLYEEFREAGNDKYPDALSLIRETPEFFEDVVMKRLTEDFKSVYRFAANHFEGSNLYIEGIQRNISQIRTNLCQ